MPHPIPSIDSQLTTDDVQDKQTEGGRMWIHRHIQRQTTTYCIVHPIPSYPLSPLEIKKQHQQKEREKGTEPKGKTVHPSLPSLVRLSPLFLLALFDKAGRQLNYLITELSFFLTVRQRSHIDTHPCLPRGQPTSNKDNRVQGR